MKKNKLTITLSNSISNLLLSLFSIPAGVVFVPARITYFNRR